MTRSPQNFITLNKDHVVKVGDPVTMDAEASKAVIARQIGLDSGLFVVPAVLEHDVASGRVVFERIFNIARVDEEIVYGVQWENLVHRIGRSLAAIHRKMVLPAELRVPLPGELAMEGDSGVWLHGDFNTTNLCLRFPGRELVILDWHMTSMHGGIATWGTRYFDLAWFINSLFFRPWPKFLFLLRSPHEAARAFLRAYYEVVRFPWREAEFGEYLCNFVAMKIRRRREVLPWYRRVQLAWSHARFRAFAHTMSI